MPLYNTAPFVRAAVESVLAQTFADFELLVVDDASTDGGPEQVEALGDSRVRLLRTPGQGGPAAARNRGLAEARGRHVAFFDSDDVAAPAMLAELLAFLQSHPEYRMAAGWLETIDGQGRATGAPEGYRDRPEKLSATMLFRNCLPTSTLLMDRRCLEGARFDETLTIASDFDLWARLAVAHPAAVLPRKLAQYRCHSQNITHRKQALAAECLERIFRRQLGRLGVKASAEEHALHRQLAQLTIGTTKETVGAIESWLLKLAEANAKSAVYPVKAFCETLADQWYSACHSACGHGFWTWRRFRGSLLARRLSPSLGRRCELLRLSARGAVKALIRGSKQGNLPGAPST